MANWPSRVATSLLVANIAIASSPSQADDDIPSLEMLEFLGGWENDDGDSFDLWYWKEFFDENVAGPDFTGSIETDETQTTEQGKPSVSIERQQQGNESSNTNNDVKVKDDES